VFTPNDPVEFKCREHSDKAGRNSKPWFTDPYQTANKQPDKDASYYSFNYHFRNYSPGKEFAKTK
jgi:hypothetical protein